MPAWLGPALLTQLIIAVFYFRSVIANVGAKVPKRVRKLRDHWSHGPQGAFSMYLISCTPLLVLVCSAHVFIFRVVLYGVLGTTAPAWIRSRLLPLGAFVGGQLLNKVLNRHLKRFFGQLRPSSSGSDKESLGMPSYHAQASAYAAYCLLPSLGACCGVGTSAPVAVGMNAGDAGRSGAGVAQVAIVATAGAVSVSRVFLRRHTWAQVVGGCVAGTAWAVLAASAWERACSSLTDPLHAGVC